MYQHGRGQLLPRRALEEETSDRRFKKAHCSSETCIFCECACALDMIYLCRKAQLFWTHSLSRVIFKYFYFYILLDLERGKGDEREAYKCFWRIKCARTIMKNIWKRLQWAGYCCACSWACRAAILRSLMEVDNNWLQMLWKQLVMQNYFAVVSV